MPKPDFLFGEEHAALLRDHAALLERFIDLKADHERLTADPSELAQQYQALQNLYTQECQRAAAAEAEIESLCDSMADLQIRYDAALAQQDVLLQRNLTLSNALERALTVLANLQKALEKRHAPIPEDLAPAAPLYIM